MIYFAAFPSPPQCSVPKEVLVWILVLPQLVKASAKGEGGGHKVGTGNLVSKRQGGVR